MRDDIRQGALHAVLAAAAFALTGVCVKWAAESAPNEVVVFFRCAVSLLAFLPWILRRGARVVYTRRPGGHLLRAAFGCAAMYCFFYTIGRLPLAEAMLLTYSTPLWIPFIAWLWIQERPPAVALPASLLGLLGLALIVKPGALHIDWRAGLIGVSSGLFAAMAMVNIRRISDTEPAERIVFYFAALSTLITAVPLLWAWRTPDLATLAALVGAGLFATLGQLQLTRAYACAPAARVGPFTYTSVLFSGVLAWLIWDERLDLWSVIGAAVVVASCLLAGWRQRTPALR
jgi:drug/metabolite transporter (DMT)-like permease